MAVDGEAPLFRRIVETSRYLFVVLDSELRVVFASPVCTDLLGYRPDEMIGMIGVELLHPDDFDVAVGALAQLVDESRGRLGVGVPLIARVRTKSGGFRTFEIGAQVQLDDPAVNGVILRLRPIEGQAFLDLALEALVGGDHVEDVLLLLARSVSAEVSPADASVSFGWDGTRFASSVSTGLPALLDGTVPTDEEAPWHRALQSGQPRDTMVSDLPRQLAGPAEAMGLGACWVVPVPVAPDDDPACLIVWRADGDTMWVSHTVALGRVAQLVALAFRHRHDAARLLHAATHDALTGVANRARFFHELGTARDAVGGPATGVLYLDLDDFKPVNDEHGHAAGDAVLRAVTERIAASVRPDDLVARLGGDEFAVLCRGVRDPDELIAVAERLVAHVSEPLHLAGATVRVAASVGVSFSSWAEPTDQLLERADDALRTAKAQGKGRWHLAPDGRNHP